MIFSNLVVANPDTYRIDNIHSFANWATLHVVPKVFLAFNGIMGKLIIGSTSLAGPSIMAKINVLSINSSQAK